MSAILVTGGAGYIGSHTTWQLLERGYQPIVLDNLYSGHRWAIPEGVPFYQGDIADKNLVTKILKEHQVQSVIHFAAHLAVEESVLDPLKYYRNNFQGSLALFSVCLEHGIREVIFSSTAATYGNQMQGPVFEETPQSPINPYGRTKLMTEAMLFDLATGPYKDLKYIILRYFNVAGARLDGKLGLATPGATHLIKIACEVATGARSQMKVFGTDYPTEDGTCVRDYIHVEDLANAHIQALEYQRSKSYTESGVTPIFNLGYGQGLSVLQVIESMSKVNGKKIAFELAGRRLGDPAYVVANSDKAQKYLKWIPKYNNLEVICRSALDWEKKIAANADQFKTRGPGTNNG